MMLPLQAACQQFSLPRDVENAAAFRMYLLPHQSNYFHVSDLPVGNTRRDYSVACWGSGKADDAEATCTLGIEAFNNGYTGVLTRNHNALFKHIRSF